MIPSYVYDVHDSGSIKYIDMEYVDGRPLNELKIDGKGGVLPENEVRPLAIKIAEALAYAHGKGVIHRDIKPQNVMVTDGGDVKIMDFGISESVRTSMSRLANSSSSGTLVCMAPEQVKGKDVGPEADIYSFGDMLYELLSGHPPFWKGSIEYQIFNETPKPLEGVSGGMNALVLKCLEKDYHDRFSGCEEVITFFKEKSDVPIRKKARTSGKRHFETNHLIERIINLDPDANTLLVELEAITEKIAGSGGAEKALEKLEDLLDERPGNVIILSALSLLHRQIGAIDEEHHNLIQLMVNERKGVEMPGVLGLLKERRQAIDDMRESLDNVFEGDRKDIEALLDRAQNEKLLSRKEIESTRQKIQDSRRASNVSIEKRHLVFIEGGSFKMGSDFSHDDEKPEHNVTVSSFYLSKYEVTQGLWEEVMGSNPANTSCGFGPEYPVNDISWRDAVNFCNILSEMDDLQPVYTLSDEGVICEWSRNGYRLPTEAEWEYAARGGIKSKRYTYAGSNTINDVAWYWSNSGYKTHPVGQKQANKLGLYDMSGNVGEWCWDRYGSYDVNVEANPRGPAEGISRVNRGGSYSMSASMCHPTSRYGARLIRSTAIGFRLARSAID